MKSLPLTILGLTLLSALAVLLVGVQLAMSAAVLIPTALLKFAGVFSKQIRELPEMTYQFTAPFVIDAADTTTTFGLEATPLDQQVDATIASYRTND